MLADPGIKDDLNEFHIKIKARRRTQTKRGKTHNKTEPITAKRESEHAIEKAQNISRLEIQANLTRQSSRKIYQDLI